MVKIGLFYGSTTGNTQKVAEIIAEAFGRVEVDLHDVRKASADDLEKYDVLILGTSTWQWGGLQDEWANFEDALDEVDLDDKKIALFGVGDQKRYPDHFVDGIGLLYDGIISGGAEVIGKWPVEGYQFNESAAQIEDEFVGLALDEDNESDKTPERVKKWVSQLKEELGLD